MTDTATVRRVDSLDFAIEYDGPALANHEMDVRDLAPALLDAADLFQNLNRLTHPTDYDVQVNIQAAREGSFLIELKLAYDAYVSTVTNPVLEGTEGLAGLVALVVGLIKYTSKRGRSGAPSDVQTIPDGMVRLIWSDNSTLTIPADSVRLADSAPIRRPLTAMVRPIERNGIDVVRLKRGEDVLTEVEKADLPAYQQDSYEERDILSESDRDTYLTIRNAPLDEGLRWRFYDGLANFSAFVTDQEFNTRIDSRQEVFGKGDVLHATIHTVQWRDEQGIHSDIEVTRVIEHIPPAQPDPTMF